MMKMVAQSQQKEAVAAVIDILEPFSFYNLGG